MKTCLTIDLDYWTYCYKTFRFWATTFIGDCIEFADDVVIIDTHDQILDHVTDEYGKVINVDFHNDICPTSCFPCRKKKSELNEGTWGNFLPKSVSQFVWYYPEKKRCLTDGKGVCGVGDLDDVEYPLQYRFYRDCRTMPTRKSDLLVICKSESWDNGTLYEYMRWIDIFMDKK